MEKARISLLAAIFGSVFCILGRTILTPAAAKVAATPFAFPADVPLPEWQLKSSRALAVPTTANPSYLSGRYYQYIHNGFTLDIEMRYVINIKGDVKSLIKNYSSMRPSGQLSLVLRQHRGIGFYSLFVDQQRAYLSSCINSRGGSTVTVSQFRHNRYVYDNIFNINFKERLIPWLQGRGSIQDMRCLWAHLSVPLKHTSSETTYQTLEKAWFSWYQWWYPRFPPS